MKIQPEILKQERIIIVRIILNDDGSMVSLVELSDMTVIIVVVVVLNASESLLIIIVLRRCREVID